MCLHMCICNAVFIAQDFNLEAYRLLYYSEVLGLLLYSAETWAPMQVV